MSATLAGLMSWNLTALDAKADDLTERRRAIVGLKDELDDAVPPGSWKEAAAEIARFRHDEIVAVIEDAVIQSSVVVRALDDAGATLHLLKEQVQGVTAAAKQSSFSVDLASGLVTDTSPPVLPADASPGDVETARVERQAAMDELVDDLEQAQRALTHTDVELAHALNLAIGDLPDPTSLDQAVDIGDRLGEGTTLTAPENGSAADNAAWWAGLTRDEQQYLIEHDPDLLGNRDGIPADVRDHANRNRLPGLKAEAQAEYAAAKEAHERLFDQPVTSGDVGKIQAAWKRVEAAQERIDALDRIQHVLAKDSFDNSHDDRQLLTLDVSGPAPKAALAIGHVESADHVNVFVPGMGTTVAKDIESYDNQLSSLNNDAESQGNGSVATVTWIGYAAPHDLMAANTDDYARAGAPDLVNFLRGINNSRSTDPHLTLMAHSYGSYVAGLAMREQTGVDQAIVFGSPGIGADQISELKIPQDALFVAEAPQDMVAAEPAVVISAGPDGDDVEDIPGAHRIELGHARLVTPDGHVYFESPPIAGAPNPQTMAIDPATGETIPVDQLPDGTQRFESSTGHSRYITPGTYSAHVMAQLSAGVPADQIEGISTVE